MTGYGTGSAEAVEQGLRIQIELTSVNRKTLDINLSAPREWNGLEQRFTDWLKGALERGRLQIALKLEPLGEGNAHIAWDTGQMKEALAALRSFAESEGVPFQPDASLLFELAQNFKKTAGLPDWREMESAIETAFRGALGDLNAMREAEGQTLHKDLTSRLGEMRKLVAGIEACARDLPQTHHARLLERLSEIGLELDLSDERVLKEVALFADRCDISEELTRLCSHFEQFADMLGSARPSGRKMDFLCQEIHREFNTTGSKASHIDITRAVIEGKNALERIREQVQNVE